ncbi:MAG: xanthine dehydrogenase family protein molybdopterin-binding subunit [Chloroflexi bacterium]|nr:xanthine dehydrogenase family protein molybdopterin-binding subunit [Chloroflexota bacterium]
MSEPRLAETIVNVSRRHFIKAGATLGGGLVLAVHLPGRWPGAEAAESGRVDEAADGGAPFAPNAFLRIAPDGTVTVLSKHSEMGQGVYTSLSMVVAEELDADWRKVRVEAAPAHPDYAHSQWGGLQGTGGSTSSHESFEQMRKAGATARSMLIAAAAAAWGVDAAACRTENGSVIHSGGRKLAYGELAERAANMPVPADVALKERKDFRLIGKATPRLDSPEKTNGSGIFGMDVKVPGLLTAVVARPPVFGGKVKSFDGARAKAIPGVRAVVEIPSGVAVVANDFWTAKRGRDALEVSWDDGPLARLDSAEQGREYAELARQTGAIARRDGDPDKAFADAPKKIEAVFDFPYLAHASMEPLNATAHVRDGEVEVWAPTQFQTIDQAAAARIAGVEPAQVTLHTVLLGGGFGRRANPAADFVSEAVHVSKAVGAPVKVVWTREDDTRGGFYRPRTHVTARVGVGADGRLVSWESRVVNQSIVRGTPFEKFLFKDMVDGTQVEGLADLSYDAWSVLVAYHIAPAGVPVLWWRSVGHSFSAFVKETLIDECATLAGEDPVAYRLRHLDKHPRQQAALRLAADKAGWGKPASGRFQGAAVHESFGSIVSQIAEVSIADGGGVRLHKVTCVIDAGSVINPDTVTAQMESGIVFGLSMALYGAITLKDGRVEQSNFHDYPVVRMNEMPEVDVHIIESGAQMGGVGEPGVPPLAPAMANAIFAATGKRLRSLPIRPADLKRA